MLALAPFLLSIASSLAFRVMSALGFGILSYVAVKAVTSSITDQVTASYHNIGGSALVILNMAGFGDALGIIIAAFVIKAALSAVQKFSLTASKAA